MRTRFMTKLRAIVRRGAPSLRNVIFSYFNYWPVRHLGQHWLVDTPVYCISLRRAPRRRSNVERQARLLGLRRLQIVEAVDSKHLDKQTLISDGTYDEDASKRWHSEGLTINEIACSLSHLECYRRIVSANDPWALVIEDDALFRASRLRYLSLENVPQWANIVLLNSFLEKTPPSGSLGGALYSDESYAGSAAAYLLTAGTASQLLNAGAPVVHAADGLIGRALDWKSAEPHSFRQRGCELKLRAVLMYPEGVTNGSTEHYYRSSLR